MPKRRTTKLTLGGVIMLKFTRTGVAVLVSFFLIIVLVAPSVAQAADQRGKVTLASGWTHYASGYRPVSVAKSGNVVTVSGLLRKVGGGKWAHVATLPSGMRPSKRLIFNVNTQDRTARVDVLPNGQIYFITGKTTHGWLSLEGISFVVGKTHPLKLTSGWQNYGGGYANANELKVGNTVTIGGLVKPGSGTVIATLPGHLRPLKRHIFNLNSHDKTSRVDVLPNGQIIWVYRAPSRGWVSLDGIRFQRKPGRALQLVNGWKQYAGGYAPGTVTRVGNRISVNGLLRSGRWGHAANLPKGMCPESRLIFNLNNHERTSRVDVLPDCRIIWVAGGKGHGWLSLEGVSFVLKKGGATAAKAPPKPKSSPGISIPWKTLAGKAIDIDVGPNGTAWIVSTNKSIWRWDGRQFKKMTGGAKRIAVDPQGNAWFVNQNRDIYRFNGKSWQKIQGKAFDIDVGANGTVWIIGSNKSIWRWDGRQFKKCRVAPIALPSIQRVMPGSSIKIATSTCLTAGHGKKWWAKPLILQSVAMATCGMSAPITRHTSGTAELG